MPTEVENQAGIDAIKAAPKAAVDFYAEWCPPWKMIGPKFNALAEEYPGIQFFKANVDNADVNPLVVEFEISAMPTFVFLKDGAAVNRLEGTSEEILKDYLEKLNA